RGREPAGAHRLQPVVVHGARRHEGGAPSHRRHRTRSAPSGRQEMIRVNLLPKDERAHQGGGGGPKIDFKVGEWVLPITILAAVGAIITGTVVAQRVAMASITKSIADVDAQSRALAPQIERVNRLAQEKAELDLRLGVISKLEEGRTEGVRMLD